MYQTLKQRSGISEFILESVCRDFLEKHGRFPYLDEIPGSNSESYLKDRLKVTEHGGAKITNILEVAGKGTVEEAIVSINNQFRDLETTIIPINKEALVDIVHRPTDDNFDNWSEEDEILARAPRDDSGNLLAPNGKISNLTEKQYVQIRTKAFKRWFGDWEKFANITEEELQAASLIFDRVPELAKIGTPTEYAAYIKEIFPNSVEKEVYWHGSNEDFSEGFASAKRGEGSGALETKKRNDLYLNKQGWASLQYVNGINRKDRDKNGFAHWNKLWWELKEIMSNGRRENNDWKDIVIDESTIRQAIPNKKGVFNRDSGGKNGKWLSERKADYGYENKSDKEFFEEIFGIKLGKDTFNTWTARNAEIFKSLEKSAKGINPVVIDVRNPITEEGQNTYYEEQRGLFTTADDKGNDAILSKKADNEFNSDVAVVINANNDNVYWLGTKSDIERFRQWKTNNNVSKVVDENGEPLVVYHGTNIENISIFDRTQIPEEQTLVGTGTATFGNFFSDKKDDAKSFADITRLRRNRGKATIYDTFLSIKNPMYFETLGDFRDYSHKEGHYNENGDFVSDVKLPKEYDGIIVKRRNSRDDAKEFVAPNPNQIKSATSNSGSFNRLSGNIYDIEPNDYLVLNNTLQKLAKLYGINFNTVTDAELNSERWADLMPESRLVNAFIYDGQIYINVDRAKLDAPIHEMLHIFVGSMRFTNPKLYQELIQLSEKFPNYDKLASQFSGKTRNDINEEVFITEVSKHLTGQKSSLTGIDEKLLYEISYNVHRVLDSVLMGTESSKTITDDRLYTLSLKDLAFELNSAIMTNNIPPLRDSELHRTLNNMKSDLMKEGKLEEICD